MNDTMVDFKISEDDAQELVRYTDKIISTNNEVMAYLDGLYSGSDDSTAAIYSSMLDEVSEKLRIIRYYVKSSLGRTDIDVLDTPGSFLVIG